jgi:hypothetical protein
MMSQEACTRRFFLQLADAVTDDQALAAIRAAIDDHVPTRKIIDATIQWDDMRKRAVQYLRATP